VPFHRLAVFTTATSGEQREHVKLHPWPSLGQARSDLRLLEDSDIQHLSATGLEGKAVVRQAAAVLRLLAAYLPDRNQALAGADSAACQADARANCFALLLWPRKRPTVRIANLVTDVGQQYDHVTTTVGYGGSGEASAHFGLGPSILIRLRRLSGQLPRGSDSKTFAPDRCLEIEEPE
jgi:hypothetical protein